jgi:hypothetical protein
MATGYVSGVADHFATSGVPDLAKIQRVGGIWWAVLARVVGPDAATATATGAYRIIPGLDVVKYSPFAAQSPDFVDNIHAGGGMLTNYWRLFLGVVPGVLA